MLSSKNVTVQTCISPFCHMVCEVKYELIHKVSHVFNHFDFNVD